jgi:valyl-tRNA synthetase
MKRFHARKAVEDELKKIGLWKEKKNNKMRLAFCQRSKDVVEPMIRPQWWVNCSEIKKPMLEVVKTKEL